MVIGISGEEFGDDKGGKIGVMVMIRRKEWLIKNGNA